MARNDARNHDSEKEKAPNNKAYYLGRCQRLRERFLKDFGASLPDYELLEILLFSAHPRGDVKPLAKALLSRFHGSLAERLAADPHKITKVKGGKAAAVPALRAVNAAAIRVAREQVMNRPALSSWQAAILYCHTAMVREKRQHFRILLLDRRNMLMADEIQATGMTDHTPVYPCEMVKRALELEAAAIIMVHNHPSGDPTPSTADIEMTRQVREAAEKLGIVLHEHIVIGRNGYTSFKNAGLM